MIGAEVYLWGTKVGSIVLDRQTGVSSFEYTQDFISSGIQISPLMMPLSKMTFSFPGLSYRSFYGLPGMLADSLPDKFGNAVISSWLQACGRTPDTFSPIDRLCYMGRRGMGALEFVPSLGFFQKGDNQIQVDQMVSLASQILNERERVHVSLHSAAMQDLIQVGTSAGGARAKAIIAWNETTNDVRSGQIEAGAGYHYWLMKFDGVSGNKDKEQEDDPQYTRIEYAYSLMAKAAGIQMTECRLMEENGRYHFLTKRFDREETSGDKIHMQTLGGIAHMDYNSPGQYSYEQAAQVMSLLHISHKEFCEFFRRMVFNVMTRNNDDHVKNISFLMSRSGQWYLSPAYDVTYAFNPDGLWTGSHQMSIHGQRNHISMEDILSAGRTMRLKENEMQQILEEVRLSVLRWKEFASMAFLSEEKATQIQNTFEWL